VKWGLLPTEWGRIPAGLNVSRYFDVVEGYVHAGQRLQRDEEPKE
jgi:hypothetical protein